MSLVWWWTEVGPRTIAKLKKDCVLADTVDGVQIWRAQNGFSRLTPSSGEDSMSNRLFSSIKEAKDAIKYMK